MAGLAFSLGARTAHAQALPPFFGGPITAFDVEVRIIDSGALLEAQAMVSNDQRYVTITAQPTNSALLALQQFRTQTITFGGGSGFVGGVDPTGKAKLKPPRSLPSEIDRADRNAASILNRRGIYLLTPLK